jgi:iron complex outermembrane receptor protein
MKKIFIILQFISIVTLGQDTLTGSLSEIEVTGVRTDSRTPITQKIITDSLINKISYGNEFSFLLSNTPSVVLQSDGGHPNGYTSFRIRGIDQTRINVTLNGVMMNEPEDQGVYFSNYLNF